MDTKKRSSRVKAAAFVLCCVVVLAIVSVALSQQGQIHALDANGAPMYKVDPFWPKPLPNRWSGAA